MTAYLNPTERVQRLLDSASSSGHIGTSRRANVHKLDKPRPRCEDARVTGHKPKIDGRSQQVLRVLLESSTSVSGRRVADVLNISPTTASKVLKALLDRGLVNAHPS